MQPAPAEVIKITIFGPSPYKQFLEPPLVGKKDVGNFQGDSGTEPEPEPSEPFFPKPKAEPEPPEPFSQEPKPEPEPSFSVKMCWNTEKPFLQRNRRNRKPEPLEPFHPRTVTEPIRTGASLNFALSISRKDSRSRNY